MFLLKGGRVLYPQGNLANPAQTSPLSSRCALTVTWTMNNDGGDDENEGDGDSTAEDDNSYLESSVAALLLLRMM